MRSMGMDGSEGEEWGGVEVWVVEMVGEGVGGVGWSGGVRDGIGGGAGINVATGLQLVQITTDTLLHKISPRISIEIIISLHLL